MASDPTSTPSSAPESGKDESQQDLQYAPITYGGRASMSSTSTRHNNGDVQPPPQAHRHSQHSSTKEHRDPKLDMALPYRTLTAEANMAEYTTEDPRGEIPINRTATVQRPNEAAPHEEPYKLVTFTPGDPENPRNWSKGYRWYCTLVVAATCFVVALCSSVITADIISVAKEFNVSQEVALVPISVFVVGFGVGPMAFAPLSEIYGRRII